MSFVSARDFLVSDDKFPTCYPVDKLLEQHCYTSAAGLLQLVRFYVCTCNHYVGMIRCVHHFQEVIPCLNDHMEDTCSVELLEYIRKMVMGMIQQKNEAKVCTYNCYREYDISFNYTCKLSVINVFLWLFILLNYNRSSVDSSTNSWNPYYKIL